jgi:hypothetical protein
VVEPFDIHRSGGRDRAVRLVEPLRVRDGDSPRVVILSRGYTERMDVHPWPTLPDEDRWLTEAMERRLRETNQSVEELRARARELRVEAGRSDMKETREAELALADRYEQAATARLLA